MRPLSVHPDPSGTQITHSVGCLRIHATCPSTWDSFPSFRLGARALIPTHGQALVVAYWAMSILALVYLGFAPWIPRSKLATAR
jgi:hypothetical protein